MEVRRRGDIQGKGEGSGEITVITLIRLTNNAAFSKTPGRLSENTPSVLSIRKFLMIYSNKSSFILVIQQKYIMK